MPIVYISFIIIYFEVEQGHLRGALKCKSKLLFIIIIIIVLFIWLPLPLAFASRSSRLGESTHNTLHLCILEIMHQDSMIIILLTVSFIYHLQEPGLSSGKWT